MTYQVYSLKKRNSLKKEHDKVGDSVWPEFMGHDLIFTDNWGKIFIEYPEYQLAFIQNDKVIAVANCIPCFFDLPLDRLPEDGWDWVITKGLEDKQKGIKPNILNGLRIVVDQELQSKGISSLILKELISLSHQQGYAYLAVPVRPTLKSKYPLIPIDEYITWKREDGLPFDPWIRAHVKLGARIIKPCPSSMYISGSITEWENWTGLRMPSSGEYIIDGALTPVKIDHASNIGEYVEPNVWVVHDTE